MSLRVVYTDDFPADVAEQARWYARQRDEALALDYAHAVEATLEFLAQHPHLGSPCRYAEPQLADLRFYLVEKPFNRHLIRRGTGRIPRGARSALPPAPPARSAGGGMIQIAMPVLRWAGSRAATLAPGSPAPHNEAQLPRAKCGVAKSSTSPRGRILFAR